MVDASDLARIKGSTDPVLIMGGGYDPAAEDARPAAGDSWFTECMSINMLTGARLGWLATDYSVLATSLLSTPMATGYGTAPIRRCERSSLSVDIEDAAGEVRQRQHGESRKFGA